MRRFVSGVNQESAVLLMFAFSLWDIVLLRLSRLTEFMFGEVNICSFSAFACLAVDSTGRQPVAAKELKRLLQASSENSTT